MPWRFTVKSTDRHLRTAKDAFTEVTARKDGARVPRLPALFPCAFRAAQCRLSNELVGSPSDMGRGRKSHFMGRGRKSHFTTPRSSSRTWIKKPAPREGGAALANNHRTPGRLTSSHLPAAVTRELTRSIRRLEASFHNPLFDEVPIRTVAKRSEVSEITSADFLNSVGTIRAANSLHKRTGLGVFRLPR